MASAQPKVGTREVSHPLDNPNISTLSSNPDAATRPATRGTAAPTAIRHNAPDADARPKPTADKALPTHRIRSVALYPRHATIGETFRANQTGSRNTV